MKNHAPDVVYPLKKKSQYEELRYSLRSLQNVPHGRVFISGVELPKWAKNITHVKTERIAGETKHQNAMRNWVNACEHPELSDDFIAMNDDFFIMKQIDEIKTYHDGDLLGCIRFRAQQGVHPNYEIAMRTNLKLLQEMGIKNPLSYDMHFPMILNKQKRINIHHMFLEYIRNNQIMLIRTLYGNIYQIGGEPRIDTKMVDGKDYSEYDHTYLSTNDASFKYENIGKLIRETFSEKSQYEI